MTMTFSAMEKRFFEWFSKEKRWTFFLSVLTGILTHFILLTEGFMSQDGLCKSIRYYSEDFDISIGRWGIRLFEPLRANYTIVYLSAIVSILLVAAAAVLLTDLLQICSMTGCIITGILLEVSPSLTATMLHEYVSDLYFLSLIFILIATIALIRCKKILIATVLCIVFTVLSLSLYQSYIGMEVGLCVIVTVIALLDGKQSVKTILKEFLRYALTVLGGLIVYLGLVKLVQAVTGVGAGAYGGLSDMTIGSVLASLPASVSNAYHSFLRYFIRDDYVYNTAWHREVWFLLFFLCFAVIIFSRVIRNKIYREAGRLVFLLILMLCYPAAVNIIALIVPTTEIYLLTSLQMLLVVPFFFAVCEKSPDTKPIFFVRIGGVVMALVIIATYFMSDIISYKGLKETYDQAIYGAERILDRMEQTSGYDRNMPVAFAGWFTEENYPKDESFWDYSIGPMVSWQMTHGDYYPNTESIRRFYLQFFDEQIVVADPATFTMIIQSPEFTEMGTFPAADSVKIINGVMTVKMMNNPWPPY